MLSKSLEIETDLEINMVIQKINSSIDKGFLVYYDSVFLGKIVGNRMIGSINGPGMSMNVFSNKVDGEITSNSDGTIINLKITPHYSNYVIPILIMGIGVFLSANIDSNRHEFLDLSFLLGTFVLAIITVFVFIIKFNWDIGRLKYWIEYRLKYK